MSERKILLPLTEREAAAVAVALVGLIHVDAPGNPFQSRWASDASVVARRLEVLRDILEGEHDD